jgi:hypothetical protein
MDKLKSNGQLKIIVESENLVMHGSSTESAGCVLRGILQLSLQDSMKIKSISMQLEGKMMVSFMEGKEKDALCAY